MNLNEIWEARGEYFNWLHMYSMFMTIAFLVVIITSWLQFWKRKIPTRPLELAIFITIPFGVLGASFFGKLDIATPLPFYMLFEFWLPGLSVYGGMVTASIVGSIWFFYCSKRYKISMWVYADLIFPNILLGQAIGRWGNFFNHELLGSPVSYESLKWLPAFIRDNCFQWYHPANPGDGFYPTKAWGINHSGPVDVNDHNKVQYYSPIFLYESFSNFMLWLLIQFATKPIYHSIGKKPWNINKEQKRLNKSMWIQYFYEVKPDWEKYNFEQINLHIEYEKKVRKIRKKHRFKIWLNYKWLRCKQIVKQKNESLEQVENPYNMKPLRCGVKTGLYVFGYNLLRFILEMQRADSDLFIKNIRWLDYILIWIFILFGAILILQSQFISPYRWRQRGWYYEKQY